MENIIEDIEKLYKEFKKNKSINASSEAGWKSTLKKCFKHMRKEENEIKVSHKKASMNKLYTKGMDIEQIWQQLEIQNELLLSMSDNLESDNLWYKVTNLCSQVVKEVPDSEHIHNESSDEGVESGSCGEEEIEDEFGENDEQQLNDEESDEQQLNDEESDIEDGEEDTLDEIDKDVNSDLHNLNDSDFDADTFGDIAPEDAEDDSEGEERVKDFPDDKSEDESSSNEEEIKSKYLFSSEKNFGKTHVDTQFLNLRESEWVADNDLIAPKDSDSEEIDYMEDLGSDTEVGKEAMYSDFFDPPKEESLLSEEKDYSVKVKSSFEKQLEREKEAIDKLEQENISEKPWFLKGEVQRDQRPENSTLEEDLSFNVAVRQKPIISDEIMVQIERIVLSRINTKAWDDVERKVKPVIDPFQYKKSLVLDQEKSKKSLAEIYEEEYLKLQEKAIKPGEEAGPSVLLSKKLSPDEDLPEHKVIKDSMEDLFLKLNALSNYHYTPRVNNAELKVVSNLPAISVEETTPVTASDSALLAPEEVVAPLRGDPKGQMEKTSTDRKRERRRKKAHQQQRAKREESKLKEHVKKRSKDGKLASSNDSIKLLQKAVKKGQVKVLDSDQKATKSSSEFFQQLQSLKRKGREDSSRKESAAKKRKKNGKSLSASKVLL